MDPLKHLTPESPDPEGRGKGARRKAEKGRGEAPPPPETGEAAEPAIGGGAAGGEEAAPEFFVMEPEPSPGTEPSETEEFVLSGAKEAEEDQNWLLRGGDEVMEANAEPAELAPVQPDEVEEAAAAVGAAPGRTAERGGRVRRFFKFGSMAAAAVLLLCLGIVSTRSGLFRKKAPSGVVVARRTEPKAPPVQPPEPRKSPVAETVPGPTPAAPRPETVPPSPPPEDIRRPAAPEPQPTLPVPAPPIPTGPLSVRTPGGDYILLSAGEVLLTLRNGNYFTGRIYKINSEQLTLRVPGGEIVFTMKTLAKIVPLGGGDKEKDELAHLPSGYVELHNGNRIWGKILEETPQYAAIAFASAKITIPRGSIRAVVRSAAATVGIAE